jgi:hypothetical protein
METFLFDNYHMTHKYPDDSTVSFGGGYVFAVKPESPPQIIHYLHFSGLHWYANAQGSWVDTIDARKNILALNNFYERHRKWKRFIYPHPYRGNLIVRFNQPFQMPKSIVGGSGLTESFDIEFIEHPE